MEREFLWKGVGWGWGFEGEREGREELFSSPDPPSPVPSGGDSVLAPFLHCAQECSMAEYQHMSTPYTAVGFC